MFRARLTPTTFFEQALVILDEDGYSGLKLAPLCRRLGVTTGAFYYNFDNWADFTASFLAYWRDDRTGRLIGLLEAETDPIRQLDSLLAAAVGLPHGAEAAIRAWGTTDPQAAEIQRVVDTARMRIVEETFAEFVPAEEAVHFATTALFLLAGYESVRDPSQQEHLEWALNRLIESAVVAPTAPPADKN